MPFKDRLAELLKTLNISQIRLSRETGISRTAISEYISGHSSPTVHVLEKIAISTGTNLNWLLIGEGPMFRTATPSSAIPIEDIPKENLKAWIDDFWSKASQEEKHWLAIEMARKFPEFVEFLKKMEGGTEMDKPLVGNLD
jgi:transcriptional regulator with XRE-family HTH domain